MKRQLACLEAACGQRCSRAAHGPAAAAPASRTDYKQTLGEADFALFVALRRWRQTQAEADSVPLYAVFTFQHKAAFAERHGHSLAEPDVLRQARLARHRVAPRAHGGLAAKLAYTQALHFRQRVWGALRETSGAGSAASQCG